MPLPRDENADLKTKLPLILLLAYLAEFILLGIAPYERAAARAILKARALSPPR